MLLWNNNYGQQDSSESKRLAWCEDLSIEITVEECQRICFKAQTQSVKPHFKFIQFKWLMRAYITPTLLNKFNPNIPDVYAKCGMNGTLFHCLWDCPYIQTFWREISDTLSCVTGEKLSMCPKLFILGIFDNNCKISRADKKMIVYCLLQAKLTIAKA